MAEIDDLTLLSAKIAVLERVVRALLRQTFSNAANPVQTAREHVERQKEWIETLRTSPTDPVPELMAAFYDSIFDPLLQELERDQYGRDPKSD